MDHGWLEDFLAAADCLHFARAAERRHMTQSAMSRRIQSLETWVGVSLFSRDLHQLVECAPAGGQDEAIWLTPCRRALQE
ncbi:LysR family transcriptional regulator (plasmid) [Lichenicola cladoniae]|uniref:LysR family transcriptional regulator n=1 Tax=Lichenicola cladoniae TaxID=1484109 RepID=A0A6M8HZM4_9PROT|nr:LysR family transcriptional regulator [Acetobacteraceae bacterium]QKE93541.1 LysR family transcriptional regulator [Lichenicola cladoniae]